MVVIIVVYIFSRIERERERRENKTQTRKTERKGKGEKKRERKIKKRRGIPMTLVYICMYIRLAPPFSSCGTHHSNTIMYMEYRSRYSNHLFYRLIYWGYFSGFMWFSAFLFPTLHHSSSPPVKHSSSNQRTPAYD